MSTIAPGGSGGGAVGGAATADIAAESSWTGPVGIQVDDGEIVILRLKPARASMLLRPLGWLIVLLFLAGVLLRIVDEPWMAGLGLKALVADILAMLCILIWQRLAWDAREYLLTDRRATWSSGVFRRLTVEARLNRIQHVVLYRSIRERACGLGTVGLATAGTDGFEIVWSMVADPEGVVRTVQQSIDRYARGRHDGVNGAVSAPAAAAAPPPPSPVEPRRIPVIGLAGGIGSGKSTVARAFERLGCVVVDSDERAKAALDRPIVRDQLVEWWGRSILGPDGSVDRSSVAKIVFSDPAQRTRLEGLVHPLIREERAKMIHDAGARNAAAVIVDAPLLFEAGVDKECDAVVFVDAPRDERLRRLKESRGWDESELQRRESAQMSPEEKRRKSAYLLTNTGTTTDLEKQVEGILRAVGRAVGPA